MSASANELIYKLRSELEARLHASEDYRALLALDAVIAQMEDGKLVHAPRPKVFLSVRKASKKRKQFISQADAAEAALKEAAKPLSTPDLLKVVLKKGAKVSASTSLASALSKDVRFESIKHSGEPKWWFSHTAVPQDDDIGPSKGINPEHGDLRTGFEAKNTEHPSVRGHST